MSTLYIDKDVFGRLMRTFVEAKGGYITNLKIVTGPNNLGVGNPCFIYNPTEYAYGFWSLLQYIDEKFGPDHRLIPDSGPFERYQILSFCNYHLMSELLLPSVRINKKQGTQADITRIHTAVGELIKNLGKNAYVFGNKLSIVDIFLYVLADEITSVFPRGLPPAFSHYVGFIHERLRQISDDPTLCWPGDDGTDRDRPENDGCGFPEYAPT